MVPEVQDPKKEKANLHLSKLCGLQSLLDPAPVCQYSFTRLGPLMDALPTELQRWGQTSHNLLATISRMLEQNHSVLFCSTSLPLTGTRWVESTSKLCSVHSLTSVLSINFGSIKNYVTLIIKPGATGRGARKLSSVLCAPPPTPAKPFFVHRSEKSWWPLIVFLRIERAQEKPDSLFSPQRGYFLRIYS